LSCANFQLPQKSQTTSNDFPTISTRSTNQKMNQNPFTGMLCYIKTNPIFDDIYSNSNKTKNTLNERSGKIEDLYSMVVVADVKKYRDFLSEMDSGKPEF
jgi:hypothetical protein